ncbi:MAG: hypothetical protein AAGA95_10580 [Pseudomonadota bacterium]
MRLAIVYILGNAQGINLRAGLMRSWLRNRRHSGENVLVMKPMTWRADMKDESEILDAWEPDFTIGIGYSWGFGVGMRDLTRYAKTKIDIAIAIDPVFRSRVFPKWLRLNPLSLTRYGEIRLRPHSVGTLHLFRQFKAPPYGRDVRDDGYGRLIRHHELPCGHIEADDDPRVHEFIDSTIERHVEAYA